MKKHAKKFQQTENPLFDKIVRTIINKNGLVKINDIVPGNSNKPQNPQLNILAVMQRFLIQGLIILACWHIITIWWQQDTDWYAGLMAFLWSGNMFWFNDYLRWFKNVA